MKQVIAFLSAMVRGIAAFVSMRWLTRTREDTRWEDSDAPGEYVVIDGVSIHYIEAGRRDAPPFVMVHGFGGQTFSFRYQVAEFARDHRVVAIDLKGFGYSERPENGNYSLTEHARTVLRVMDELGIGRTVLMGHSMGGDVAMRVAASAPERVEKLILVAAAPGRKVWVAPRLAPVKLIMPGITKLSAWNAWRKMFYDRSQVDTEAVRKGYMKTARIKGTMNTVWQMWRDVRGDTQVDYSRLTMPVLILWAEKDGILPFPGFTLKWLRKRIPHAEVHTVPRTGHLVLEEQPDASNKLLREFVGGEQGKPQHETAEALA